MTTREISARLMLLAALALAIGACADPNQFLPSYQPGGPGGILGGTVTYAGPMPCTADQHVVGAAVLLAFDTRLLPPPDGLGTTATGLAAVGGDQLFGGIFDRLTFKADGSKWCPPATDPPVTVSGDFTLGALPGGEYQIRGFYDLAGTFDPVFSITKLPVAGDIAGGAIDNTAEVLVGAEPVYRRIELGTLDPTTGVYAIPPAGSNIDGIAVTLALPLPLGLPIFYPSKVQYSKHACSGTSVVARTPPKADPNDINMPSDYQLPVFNQFEPTNTQESLIVVTATGGFPASEAETASKSPFDLPVYPTPNKLTYSWQDVNGDGMLDLGADHSAASPVLPALLPLSIFSKLAVSSPPSPTDDLAAQASPAVILQGITIFKDLLTTVNWPNDSPTNATSPLNARQDTSVLVGITPAVVCLDPTDFAPDAMAVLVLSHPTDCAGNPLLTSPQGTLDALKKQFGRSVVLASNNEGACLPEGRYALNLVYGTGQAWTNPNEVGVCAAAEPESADKKSCVAAVGSRPLLASQDRLLTIGPPADASYCTTHPTPAGCCPQPPAGAKTCTPDCKTCKRTIMGKSTTRRRARPAGPRRSGSSRTARGGGSPRARPRGRTRRCSSTARGSTRRPRRRRTTSRRSSRRPARRSASSRGPSSYDLHFELARFRRDRDKPALTFPQTEQAGRGDLHHPRLAGTRRPSISAST